MQFEATAQAEAEKINRQTGAGYVTDQAFWERQGISTGEELALSVLGQTYSDYFKEIHGFRPRHAPYKTVKEYNAAIRDLDDYYDSMVAQEEIDVQHQAAIEKERKELEELMPGEFDFEHVPTKSGMGRRMESKMKKMPRLVEAMGFDQPIKELGIEQIRQIILEEIAEDEKDDKKDAGDSSLTDEEAIEAIEKNIPGAGVVSVVDFLNSPLGTDPKVRKLLRKGAEDGDPSDEEISVGSGSPTVGDMVPTQNEIDLMKSISFPLSDIGALDNAMGDTVGIGTILASGEHIIDGHHRWSSVASVNPSAKLKVVDLGLPGDADKKLAVAQVAIAAQPEVGTKPVPKATTAGAANNILGKGADEIKDMVLARVGTSSEAGEILSDKIVDHIKEKYPEKFGISEDDDPEAAREKIASTVGKNLASMKSGEGPERVYMPQFSGGDTGPALDVDSVMDTMSGGDTNFKLPVERKDESVIIERWQKLAGILRG